MAEEIHLRTSNLSKQFKNVLAVDKLTLKVPRGGIFGFLGPNGAGKSTTILMICGLLKPTEGEVVIEKGCRIGLCPQENIFWSKLSCMEQLVFTGQIYGIKSRFVKKQADALLGKLGLLEKKHTLAQNLSGGMKRRLNLALALIHDPEILVLDEPETGLDPQSRVMVRDYIKELSKSKTVILTTHNMDEAERLADNVAIIDFGKLLVLDTVANLKHSIGDGDILEMSLQEPDEKQLQKAKTEIILLGGKLSYSGHLLSYQSREALSQAGVIREILKQNRIIYMDFHLRETTLEDVFIYHTGRKLRE
jgi:ABC-2 type transport system ATP-binding protein